MKDRTLEIIFAVMNMELGFIFPLPKPRYTFTKKGGGKAKDLS